MAQQRPVYAAFLVSDEDDVPSYLTEAEREELIESLHYAQRDERTILVIVNGASMTLHTDGGEPEDNSFGRSYAWIVEALEDAFKTGQRRSRSS